MILLPNSFDRYMSSLRIFVSLSILKHGLLPKHLKNLQKIHCAEAFFYKTERQSVDINKLCTNLLGAVSIIKNRFQFSCNLCGNFVINKNIFTILLLKLAKQKQFLKITANEEFLKIGFWGNATEILPCLAALNGFSLFELKTNRTLIIIPTKKTHESSVMLESEWENIFSKFSVVNIFFERLDQT